jgi:general secretion pathway protein M
MIRELSSPHQRFLAVGLFVAMLSALIAATVWPVWSTNGAYQARIDLVQAQLGKLHANAAAHEQLRPRLEQLKRSKLSNAHYLQSGTEAVAAAELQRIVKRVAGSHGVQVLSTQILPASQESDFVRVALRVRMRGNLTSIVESLYAIESNGTFLFLDNVAIRNAGRRRSVGQITLDQFDTNFDLAGYMPEIAR